MQSMPRYSLTLTGKTRSQLRIDFPTPNEGIKTRQISLDRKLGNREGSFDLTGNNFSKSARDIALAGSILHATLCTSNGVWWEDQLLTEVSILRTDSGSEPNISFRRCEGWRLKGCRNLRLIDPFMLAAECLQLDRSYKESYLDLDLCLGTKNEVFSREGTNFSWKAQNTQLIGTTLYSDLPSQDGTLKRASIELTNIVHIKDGNLRPLRSVESLNLDLEILGNNPSDQKWLADAQNIRLVSCRRRRRWYLVAECVISPDWTRESVIRLHDILGPHDDEMFCIPFFSSPDIPERARKTKLEDGILTASFQGKGDTWVERTIDLGQIVASEKGAVRLKQFGSDCQGCKDLFYAGVFCTPWRGRRVSLNETFIKSVVSRCMLCKLLEDTIVACAPSGGPRDVWIVTNGPATTQIYYPKSERVVEVVVREKSKKSKVRNIDTKLRTILGREKNTPQTEVRGIIRLEIANNPESRDNKESISPRLFRTLALNNVDTTWLEPEQRWSTIQEWIRVCSTNHTTCRNAGIPKLPSRYLDVGRTDRDTIRLLTSPDSPGTKGIYACLSHCWGGKNIVTLNAKTESIFSKAVDKTLLPPVFTSAIAVCRRLGIQYLWIDSLCIRQDSKQDWQFESRQMGNYYSNCIVCIAATGSANSAAPFNISADRPRVVRSSGVDPVTGPFDLVAYPSSLSRYRPHFGHSHKREDLLRDFPLLTRAWVLQERWLAPRILHFCGSEVIFECAEMTTCECGAARDKIDIDKLGLWKFGATIRSTSTTSEGLLIRRKALKDVSWDDFVTAYSVLSLTQYTDRLVAISGVARTIYNSKYKQENGTTKDVKKKYLAGLWKETLARDMAWFVGESLLRNNEKDHRFEITGCGVERRPRSKQYLAPSWSWASVFDPVQYLTESNLKPLFELLDSEICLETEDPFGSVKGGCSLHLRGKILETSWEIGSGKNDTKTFIVTDLVGTQQLDRDDIHGIVFSPDFEIKKPVGPDEILSPAKLYVFPLATMDVKYARWMNSFPECTTTICLILQMGSNEDEDDCPVYRRVGFTEYANLREKTRNTDPNEYIAQEFMII